MPKNNLLDYASSLGSLASSVPALTELELDDYPYLLGGFDLGPKVTSGRSPAAPFTKAILGQLWSALPPQGRDALIGIVTDIVSLAAESSMSAVAGSVASGVSAGIPAIAAVIDGSQEIMDAWVKKIEGTRSSNDKRRRQIRLLYMDTLQEWGPQSWAGGYWTAWTYERERSGANSFPLGWPPDNSASGTSGNAKKWVGPLINEPGGAKYRRGSCGGGASDFSGGTSSSCRGWTMIFPIFFPVWCTPAIGSLGQSMQGMERTADGGQLVFSRMMAMQTSLLADPIMNLMADGEKLRKRIEYFQRYFWQSYTRPAYDDMWVSPDRRASKPMGSGAGLQWLAGDIQNPDDPMYKFGGPRFRIQKKFDPNFPAPLEKGFFMTPAGLIGTYDQNGNATVDHPDLSKAGVWRWDSIATQSDFGGNVITARDYNTVTAAGNQFFALRMATLRRQPLMEKLVADYPEMLEKSVRWGTPSDPVNGDKAGTGTWRYDLKRGAKRYPIPEPAVRKAVRASAEGMTADSVEVQVYVGGGYDLKSLKKKFAPKFGLESLKNKFRAKGTGAVDRSDLELEDAGKVSAATVATVAVVGAAAVAGPVLLGLDLLNKLTPLAAKRAKGKRK